MKEAIDDRMSSEGDGKSILRKILADDRAELTKVQKAYGAMLSGAQGDLHRLWEQQLENDALDRGAKVRMARSATVRASGAFNYRFNQHFKGTPFEFVDGINKEVLQKFLRKKLCCLRPFFCRRIRNKLKGLSVEQAIQQLMGSGFKKLLRFWVDEFETATSIRNERQHAVFSKAVRRGGNSGAIPSVQRVAVQDFGKHIFLDHEFKFGRRRAQWNTRIRFAFNKVQAGVRQLKKEMREMIHHRSGDSRVRVGHIPLGTGRTPWLHYRNKRQLASRREDESRIPKAELEVLKQEWRREFVRISCDSGDVQG